MSRIVLLYADTGGGHRSAAEAIARGFDILCPGKYEVTLVNAIPHMAYPYNQMERTYPAVVNGPRILHQLAFHATNSRRRSWIVRTLLRLSGRKMARFVFDHHPADVYVSCSPIYTQVLPHYMPRMGCATPFVVVATDLVSGHAFNYAPETNLTLVPTEYAAAQPVMAANTVRVPLHIPPPAGNWAVTVGSFLSLSVIRKSHPSSSQRRNVSASANRPSPTSAIFNRG